MFLIATVLRLGYGSGELKTKPFEGSPFCASGPFLRQTGPFPRQGEQATSTPSLAGLRNELLVRRARGFLCET